MPDNLNIKRPLDAQRININQTYEVAYWTRALGISETRLHSIINKVGNSVTAVKKYLGIL